MTKPDIPESSAPCDNDTPVYSSRIIRVYLERPVSKNQNRDEISGLKPHPPGGLQEH